MSSGLKTTKIFADTRVHATCRLCHAPIVFAVIVKSGKRMPFDLPLPPLDATVDTTDRLIEVVDLGASHFASCAYAARFRKAR